MPDSRDDEEDLQSKSSSGGEALDDDNIWREDIAEALEDNEWEKDSMLVSEGATSEDERSLQSVDYRKLEERYSGLEKQRKAKVDAMNKKIKRDRGLQGLFGDTNTVVSQSTRWDDDDDDDEDDDDQTYAGSRTTKQTKVTTQDSTTALMRTPGGDDDGEFDSDSLSDSTSDSEGPAVDLTDLRGLSSEWVEQDKIKREVRKQFRLFLRHKTPQGDTPYVQKIHSIVTLQLSSLLVEFQEIATFNEGLAVLAGEAPAVTLELFEDVASKEVFKHYPRYVDVVRTINVRLINLPISDAIRNLRCLHMNMLCQIHGVVTRRSLIYPQLQAAMFDCLSCGYTLGPLVSKVKEPKAKQCPSCQKNGPFRLNSTQTIYRNYQTVILQETPGTVPPGRLPRWIEVILLNDLVDIARPGDEIVVTGIYKNAFDPLLNHRQGFPVFTTVLEANAVRKRVDDLKECMTEEERTEILSMAKHPNIIEKIVHSISPSIHGNEMIKAGIACSLFGGVPKEVGDGKHRIRGDINVLLVGDPGCGKSQILKYTEKTSPRSVFTTGRGSTAVGLTAAVHKDSMTGEWTLEGGAMVIADKGHCLIDEFDKMSDQDRTSIHEAMEQQTISIAKAGIVTSLQARCSIIAAANPIVGHYESSQTFESQVNLTQPILSRFDLLFAVRDVVDPIQDTHLAKFVLNSHMKHHPRNVGDEDVQLIEGVKDIREDTNLDSSNPLPQKLLQRYILYARTCVQPKLEQVDMDRLVSFYVELRNDSAMKYESGIKIVVRHLESICRLSEAHAKMRLSPYVREDDVSRAISLFLNAFLGTLPFKRRETLRKKYASYLVLEKQHFQIISHVLSARVKELCQLMSLKYGSYADRDVIIPVVDLKSKAQEHKIYENDLQKFFKTSLFTTDFDLINNKQDILWKKNTQSGDTQTQTLPSSGGY